jgi:hypothetical protein
LLALLLDVVPKLAHRVNKAKRLREDLKRAETEVARYVSAIGNGGKLESLVEALAKAEARREALRREVAQAD